MRAVIPDFALKTRLFAVAALVVPLCLAACGPVPTTPPSPATPMPSPAPTATIAAARPNRHGCAIPYPCGRLSRTGRGAGEVGARRRLPAQERAGRHPVGQPLSRTDPDQRQRGLERAALAHRSGRDHQGRRGAGPGAVGVAPGLRPLHQAFFAGLPPRTRHCGPRGPLRRPGGPQVRLRGAADRDRLALRRRPAADDPERCALRCRTGPVCKRWTPTW